MSTTRRSVPHAELQIWWDAGWAYVMPDFDKPGQYIIEWLSDAPPAIPDVAAEQLAADVLADLARSA